LSAKFKKIVSEVLGIPISEISAETSPENTPYWGSIETLLLISEIEEQFEVNLDINDVAEIKNLGEIANFLNKKGINVDLK